MSAMTVKSRRRGPLVLLALLMLPGCSPPTYDIIATIEMGSLMFNGRDSEGTTRYVEATTFSVSRGDAVQWSIAFQRGDACGYEPRGGHPFPLTYGVVPECWVQSQAPIPLEDGVIYTAAGYAGSRRGGGDFRLTTGAVEFIDTLSNN